MNKIVYGNRVFTDHEIDSGSLHLATNLISAQLEANTFTAVVRSNDSTLTDFERNAKLIFYIDEKQSGIFYVQSIDRVAGEKYKIFATSAVGLLIEGRHMGGIYTGQTAQEIVSDICGTIPFIIKSNLVETKLYGWLPIASPRDNLSQVLFAIGAALKTDLDGVLRIAGLWDGVSGTTDKSRMYDGGKVEYSAKITQIVLTEHQYSEGAEEKNLFEGTAQEGDIITFNAPMHSLSATGITIRASGANWAKVSAGSGTLTGKEYVHNTRLITREVQTANVPNVKKVDKATLISLVNSAATADRLVSLYKCTETINSSVIYQGENTGNIMSTYHPFDKTAVNACLQSADITLSNTLKAQEKSLVGFEPPAFEEINTYDHSEILTGNGNWVVPGGVTSVTAVLIGGGGGGENGQDGEGTLITTSGEYVNTSNTYIRCYSGETKTASTSASSTFPGQSALNGGNGGAAGSPGKIYQIKMDVTEGDTISYSCGAGGNSGEDGGETTFGDKSSLSGAVSQTGYYDIVSGETFAKPGINGSDGDAGSNQLVGSYTGKPSPVSRNYFKSGFTSVNDQASGTSRASGAGSGGAGGKSGEVEGGDGGIAGSLGTSAYNTIKSGLADNGYGFIIQPRAPGKGGHGGNGKNGETYGSAGDGGGGGGGMGACGSCSASINVTVSGTAKEGNSSSVTAQITAIANIASGIWITGWGGTGGTGGSGAPGCIILYYGVKKTIPTGQLVDKNNRMVLDRLGRRIVV